MIPFLFWHINISIILFTHLLLLPMIWIHTNDYSIHVIFNLCFRMMITHELITTNKIVKYYIKEKGDACLMLFFGASANWAPMFTVAGGRSIAIVIDCWYSTATEFHSHLCDLVISLHHLRHSTCPLYRCLFTSSLLGRTLVIPLQYFRPLPWAPSLKVHAFLDSLNAETSFPICQRILLPFYCLLEHTSSCILLNFVKSWKFNFTNR